MIIVVETNFLELNVERVEVDGLIAANDRDGLANAYVSFIGDAQGNREAVVAKINQRRVLVEQGT